MGGTRGGGSPAGAILAAIARGFFAVSPSTVAALDRYIVEFKDRPAARAPSLFFGSDDDAMCDAEALGSLVREWRARGLDADLVRFESSPHAGHLRAHPAEYKRAFSEWLMRVDWR